MITIITLQSPHPNLVHLILQADPAQTPKPDSHWTARTARALSFFSPKASLSHRIMKQTNQTNRRTSQVTVPLSNGAALPPPPCSHQPGTSLQTQSRAPSMPWASVQWCHLLKSLRASWAFPPSLQQGKFQKGRPKAKAHSRAFRSGIWKLPETSSGSPSGAPGWPAGPSSLTGTEVDQEPSGLYPTEGWLCAPHAGHA